jgi:hypothetical protein
VRVRAQTGYAQKSILGISTYACGIFLKSLDLKQKTLVMNKRCLNSALNSRETISRRIVVPRGGYN